MFKSSDLNPIDFTKFKRIGIAYSGGVDSHVLLHSMLKEFGNSNLYALHINHGLTKNSDKWENHCSLVCKDLKVAFKSWKIDIHYYRRLHDRNPRIGMVSTSHHAGLSLVHSSLDRMADSENNKMKRLYHQCGQPIDTHIGHSYQ